MTPTQTPAARVSGTIKALEWEDLGADYWRAPAPLFGTIRIEPWGDRGFQVLWSVPGICDRLIADLFPTPEAAKSAAQADYNARIAAAIQPDPEPVAVAICKGCGNEFALGYAHVCPGLCATPSSAGTVSVEAAARVLLASCPNPIFDILKPALMGEIRERVCQTDEYGDEVTVDRQVPWDTMKTVIRAALRALAGERG